MDLIRDLSSISEYQPTKGDLLALYKLAQDPTIPRKQAIELFQKSPSHFRNTYKVLKDKLIEGALTSPLKGQNKKSETEIKIWKKHTVFLILSKANKRKAACKIGEELLVIVEKLGMINIALDLSRNLSTIYSYLGDHKYLKYKEKVEIFKVLLMEEQQVHSIHDELLYRIRKKKPITELLKQLALFDKVASTNEQYKFKLYYHSSYNLIHQLNNNINLLVKNSEAALSYCATTEVFVPELLVTFFLSQSIPIYLYHQQFAKAEAAAQKYRDHSRIGSNNWNTALQYIAILGFQSDKPQIAANVFLKLKSTTGIKQTILNKSRWYIIHAFLHLYYSVGKISFCPSFKLNKFLNEIAVSKNDSLIGNGYILELIHLLVSKNYRVYQQRAENIEQYISRNLKGSENARVKYFMRMLRSVALGNFHPVRVQAHAKKNRKKLEKTPKNLYLVDTEIVPYEKLWEIVVLHLVDQE